MDIANLEKKQYLCTVEYFVADIIGGGGTQPLPEY
jgi:hypothetical protein